MTCGKKLLTVLAAALAVAAPASAITGGSSDGNRHPAVGLLLADAGGAAGFQPSCSGALVAPATFVTAAHCFVGAASNRVLVTFDPQASGASAVTAGVAFVDPLFNTSKSDLHDLAVVQLSAPVGGVTPLALPTVGVLDAKAVRSAQVENVGYGYYDRSFVFDGVRRVSVSEVTNVGPTELRTAERPGGVCFGDSGGPRLLGSTIVALTSSGNRNCTGQSLSYRLDSPSARAFLARFVAVP